MFPYYQITLSLPVSVNQSHTLGRNAKGGKVIRSSDYTGWLQVAYFQFREQFPNGVSQKFLGRLRVDYIFIWNLNSRGKDSSDIGNREKVLSDFLQKKFFENDNQIDEQHQYRRFDNGEDRVILRIYEINDRRHDSWQNIFTKE